jgi:hypothetical protein
MSFDALDVATPRKVQNTSTNDITMRKHTERVCKQFSYAGNPSLGVIVAPLEASP